MRRREFFRTAGQGAGAFFLAPFAGGLLAEKERPPNIIFIMADDLGYGELGCYGQEKIETPHVDAMASEGMRFTQFYAGSAVCAPARCCLMTGTHGGHAYVRSNHEIGTWDSYRGQLPLPEKTETVAMLMKRRGYATGAFGKWGLGGVGSTGGPLKKGFDTFVGYNCQRHAHNLFPRYLVKDEEKLELEGNTRGLTGRHYAPQVIADHMLSFIKKNRDKPFFVYYPSVLPHLALQAPEDEIAGYRGRWPETPYKGKSYLPHPTPRACYASMITFLDKQVGRLMKLLKELKLDDNTIVFFTSDNGTTHLKNQVDYEFFKSVGPLRGLKGSLYEGGIRVPMVVRWPGRVRPQTVTHLPSAHYDVFATLSDLVDGAGDVNDGISFLPTLLSQPERQKKHDYLFWDFAGYGAQLAVRMGRWKGIKRNLKKNPDAPLELYDLKNDVSEKRNVAGEHPDIADRIEKIMVEARTKPALRSFQFGRYKK